MLVVRTIERFQIFPSHRCESFGGNEAISVCGLLFLFENYG